MFWIWAGFLLFVLALLAVDLGVFHRKAHDVRIREALIWSSVWIALALVFTVFIYFGYEKHWLGMGTHVDAVDKKINDGSSAVVKYLTGYALEKSLSVDNLFVIALVFGYFGIPAKFQHRVLFWGILGALIMRGVMIGVGTALIARFEFILYLFGLFLIYTAWKMLRVGPETDPQNNFIIRWTRRHFPVTHQLHGQRFMIRRSELKPHEPIDVPPAAAAAAAAAGAAAPPPAGPGAGDSAPVLEYSRRQPDPVPALDHAPHQPRELPPAGTSKWVLTPLFLTLLVVETTDVVFAVDSIPAIFAITTDPFLVFTSNVFAILGLRALYFALAGLLDKFKYLKVSLAVILGLIGVKMLLKNWLHQIENVSFYTLGLVALVLGAGIIASIVSSRRNPEPAAAGDGDGHGAPGEGAAKPLLADADAPDEPRRGNESAQTADAAHSR